MASIPTTSGRPRKFVHFSDNSDVISFTPTQQHDRSPSAASDDTDETIRPANHCPCSTCDESPYFSPDISDYGLSQSTLSSDEEPPNTTNTSPSSTPLLSPQPVPAIEGQFTQREQSVGYGTMIAQSSRQGSLQKTQYIPHRYTSEQVETGRYAHSLWQSFRGWLRGTKIPMQATNEAGSTTSEGPQARLEFNDPPSTSRSTRMIEGF